MIEKYDLVDVFVGVDASERDHDAVALALDRAGATLFDRAVAER